MIDDEQFLRGKIPMTKQEIRILTLAKARLNVDSIVADIGAGTGSITIEAAKISSRGKIFAIERKSEAIELIKRNVEKFSVDNVTLPELDAAIVGGSGGKCNAILDALDGKLKVGATVVVNAVTIQTAAKAVEYFRIRGWNYETIQVQITRFERVGSHDMARALNPVFIVAANCKPNQASSS